MIFHNINIAIDTLNCTNCQAPSKAPIVKTQTLSAQMSDFFKGLFETYDWPPRWYCGNWTDFHGWLYIISDIVIWASYFAIPFLLFKIINKRKDIPFPFIFWLFIAFILLCGTTHLMDAIIFWWPAYRLSALLRFITGFISIITVYALHKNLPVINNLRTQEELELEIIERKKAEEETRHLLLEKHATENLMSKKDEFMSIASHELKTPITTLKSSLQLLKRISEKEENHHSNSTLLVDKAVKQTNRLTEIIDDLLDVSKIQAGKMDLNLTNFNINDLVNECIEECNLENTHFKIEVDVKHLEIIVKADRNRLSQVICNLLTNACKYSPDSEKIIVKIEHTPQHKVKVSVIDNGIGISADHLTDVFGRFFRVEKTSQKFSGMGLGLYISSEIIKRHQGEIGVESELNRGSTFWFVI